LLNYVYWKGMDKKYSFCPKHGRNQQEKGFLID